MATPAHNPKSLVFENGKLPLFIHAVQSANAFALAQKVWDTNARTLQQDAANRKEYMFFTFAQPSCLVWLQRDQGRTDTFELVLMWDTATDDVAEIYVISVSASGAVGDDSRVCSLLSAILSMPAVVPLGQGEVQ
jgi:hypothetical protein